MLNVLINAYAVSPVWGSEPGLGWNWVVNIAKYCNVFVITEGEWKEDIENTLTKLPQRGNIHFYYNPVSPAIRKMCWNQGDWRFYRYYRLWQNQTFEIARDIISSNRIDLIHQLNMIGFREPGSLWKIDGIPFIWGPVGGYGWKTLRYLTGQPLDVKCKVVVKNVINILQGRLSPLSRNAMKKAAYILAANSDVYKYIKENFRKDVILMNETGCNEMRAPFPINKNPINKNVDGFNILWVGKFDYRKQLELAIRTVSILKEHYPFVRLNIVGDTKNRAYLRLLALAKDMQVEHNIRWYGKIINSEVHNRMLESDVFLFTSIDEGTPHVILEAIQNGLPVVCFDTCGQGDIVNEEIGIKIPLSNPKQSSIDFANAISSLIENREKIHNMSVNCYKRQHELSWDCKVQKVIGLYELALCK